MFLHWKTAHIKERDYSPFFVPRKKQMWKTALYRVQVSAWHERGFKLSDIYQKQSGRKKTGTRLNQFSSSIRLQFRHHGFNWTVTTKESWCWANSTLSSPPKAIIMTQSFIPSEDGRVWLPDGCIIETVSCLKNRNEHMLKLSLM